MRKTKIVLGTIAGAATGFIVPFIAHPRSVVRFIGWPARQIGWFVAGIFAKGQADKGIVIGCLTTVFCCGVSGAVIGYLISRRLTKTKEKPTKDSTVPSEGAPSDVQ